MASLSDFANAFFPGKKNPKISRRQSLALCPVRNPDVSWETDAEPASPDTEDSRENQFVTISVPLEKKKVLKPVRWLASKIARQAPPDSRRLQLDEVGSFVWNKSDGQTNMRQLIWIICDRYKLNRRDAESALLEFMNTLAGRNLLAFANMDHQQQ
jgi:Coenzyme PQQ synthesis protein D (PqqD)